MKHLVSKERLPFSFAYITSLALTLYFSLGVSDVAVVNPHRPLIMFSFLIGALLHWISYMCYHSGARCCGCDYVARHQLLPHRSSRSSPTSWPTSPAAYKPFASARKWLCVVREASFPSDPSVGQRRVTTLLSKIPPSFALTINYHYAFVLLSPGFHVALFEASWCGLDARDVQNL